MLVILMAVGKSYKGQGIHDLYNLYCNGHDSALWELFSQLYGVNFHTAYSILSEKVKEPKEMAKDMISDVMASFLEIKKPDRQKLNSDGHVVGFIRKSVRNRTISQIRKKAFSQIAKSLDNNTIEEIDITKGGNLFDSQTFETELTNAVIWKCIKKTLNELELAIFSLSVYKPGHLYISKIVGVEQIKVKHFLYQAKSKIKKKCFNLKKI